MTICISSPLNEKIFFGYLSSCAISEDNHACDWDEFTSSSALKSFGISLICIVIPCYRSSPQYSRTAVVREKILQYVWAGDESIFTAMFFVFGSHWITIWKYTFTIYILQYGKCYISLFCMCWQSSFIFLFQDKCFDQGIL